MSQCQFVSSDGTPCKKRTFSGLTYCWRHWPTWLKGIGILGISGAILGAIIWLISFTADLKSHGIPIPDIVGKENIPLDISGMLVPDNAPTPPYPCPKVIPEDEIKIFLGKNILGYQSKFPLTILRIAGEDLLSVNKTKKGFLVSAKVFSYDGNIVAQIEDNKFYIKRDNYFRLERPNKHTLVVHDQQARKVLDFYYINPTTIKITGIFSLPNRRPIIFDEEEGLSGGGYNYTGCVGKMGQGFFNFN
jgi:hypothetical protein